MTSVCITSEYHTIIYYDACFDPQTILVNMRYVERVHLSSLTPQYHVIVRLINFQLSMGIAMLTGLKPYFYYKCTYIYFLMLHTYLIFMYTWKTNFRLSLVSISFNEHKL